jgi:hypothetical protein
LNIPKGVIRSRKSKNGQFNGKQDNIFKNITHKRKVSQQKTFKYRGEFGRSRREAVSVPLKKQHKRDLIWKSCGTPVRK